MEPERDFKGVWIPKEIYLAPDLSALEKILLAEIDSLDHGDGSYASNEYYATFLGVGIKYIEKMLTQLRKKSYVIDRKFDGRKRFISINPRLKKDADPAKWRVLDPPKSGVSIYSSITKIRTETPTPFFSQTEKSRESKKTSPTSPDTSTVLDIFNSVMHTKYHNAKVWASNFQYWLTIYTLDDILRAIANIPHHPFWRDKMTPEILFRTKNPAREPVDYIGTLLYVKAPKKLLDGYTAL